MADQRGAEDKKSVPDSSGGAGFVTYKDAAVAIVAAILTFLATMYATARGSFDRNRELDIKMLELSLQILREDPDKSPTKAARGWAVDLINKASPVPIPPEVRRELIAKKLFISYDYGWSDYFPVSKEMIKEWQEKKAKGAQEKGSTSPK